MKCPGKAEDMSAVWWLYQALDSNQNSSQISNSSMFLVTKIYLVKVCIIGGKQMVDEYKSELRREELIRKTYTNKIIYVLTPHFFHPLFSLFV